MKKERSYNVLKVLQIIRAILIIIMSCIVLSSAIVGHCASEQDYFPMSQNKNGHFTEDWITKFNNQIDTDNYYCVVMYRYYQTSLRRHHFYLVRFPKTDTGSIFAEKNNDLIHFSLYPIGSLNAQNGTAYIQDGNLHIQWGGNYQQTWHNMESSNYNSSIDYISNFTLFTSNNPDLAQVVMFYDDGITIPEDDTAREDMEKPQINDYIPDWTNTPNFDNSSVENALESVYNGIVWLGSNIKDTITGTGEYIADTIRWAIQKILNTIRDVFSAITNKLNEVKNTILTVADKIQSIFDYISQPLQTSQVVTAIQNTNIHTDIVSLVNLSNTAFGIFGTVAEPQNFTIPLDFTGISILHQTQPFYIDLSWIIDARQYIRAFMWCIVTFGLLYSIIIGIPSMLNDSK